MPDVFKIELGKKVKDNITGFEGTTIARAEYLNGCIQYQLESNEPTKPGCDIWIDEQRLMPKEKKKKEQPPRVTYSGGGGRRNHP